LGHRGARHAAPENTLRAFELARSEGADGVELDVRLTADRKLVVFHDPTLTRVSAGHDRRAVDALSYRDFAALDMGAGERPPLLGDVLDWAAAHDQRLNIELKRDTRELGRLVTGVARLLRERSAASERVLLSSFHPGVVALLARMLPRVPSCWLVHARQRVLHRAPGWRLLGAAGVHPEWRTATTARIARWKSRGALVGVWTVNDADVARRLSADGVDCIISDAPGSILAALR
jgi:glycerophosphoryl diester phosphodiesterase